MVDQAETRFAWWNYSSYNMMEDERKEVNIHLAFF